MLELEVICDRNKFIDLKNFLLEIECKITANNDADLRTGADAATTDSPYFSNNALHAHFSECTVSSNEVKFSNKNCNYAYKAFIEREFSNRENATNKRLVFQVYYYEDEPAKIDGADNRATVVAARKALVADSKKNYFIGKPASKILIVINTYCMGKHSEYL